MDYREKNSDLDLSTFGHGRESTLDVIGAEAQGAWLRDALCERYVTRKRNHSGGGGRSKAETLGRMCTVPTRSRYSSHSASGCNFVPCVMSAGIPWYMKRRFSEKAKRDLSCDHRVRS